MEPDNGMEAVVEKMRLNHTLWILYTMLLIPKVLLMLMVTK